MRLITQSVYSASVEIRPPYEGESEAGGSVIRDISRGVLIYFGIHKEDLENYEEKVAKIMKKFPNIKMLEGENSIDQSLNDIQGEVLLIPNFTVYGRNHKGTKLDFVHSAPFTEAKKIYEYFITEAIKNWWKIKTGKFWANMIVKSENRGPLNYVFDF